IPITDVYCFLTFFFQVEDGIRDRNVTGVQTCALPILINVFKHFLKTNLVVDIFLTSRVAISFKTFFLEQSPIKNVTTSVKSIKRSEERRVGKECRYIIAHITRTKKHHLGKLASVMDLA